jgi:prepilin-type processing-associated H-X9-DG protein
MSEQTRSPERQLRQEGDRRARVDFERHEPERYELESTAPDERTADVTSGGIFEDPPVVGSTRDAATLRHLALLVQVAWADGHVSNGQRAIILSAAAMRNIEWEGRAYFRLLDWIARRPSPEEFQASLRAIRAELLALPSEQRAKRYRDLVVSCTGVALAAGDSPDIGGGINEEEQGLIDWLSLELQRNDEAPGPSPLRNERLSGTPSLLRLKE